jgi:predicted dithiol-disulfide oxidoreductase (DUF899 family)
MSAKRNVVSRSEWLEARRSHLAREKELTRLRDKLCRERRELPWVAVTEDYRFEGPAGVESLADLFAGRSQLVVYHFMYHPSWEVGCKSCSFWADNFERIDVHLAARDVTLVFVSRAPYETLAAFRERMGWSFKWVSSSPCDFNRDYHVSFSEDDIAGEVEYNFTTTRFPSEEAPGVSVFFRDGDEIFHTYSTYSRGLDMLNGAYHLLDLVPKGRDEGDLDNSMAWLRLRDQY